MAEGGIAVRPGDMPLRALCSELELPGFGPMILIGAGEVGQTIECPPRHALQAAELLVDHALTLRPRLGWEADERGPAASLLRRLLDGVGSQLAYVLAADEGAGLAHMIDKLAHEKASEMAVMTRQAAKRAGLAECRDILARLLAVCAEPSADVRAMALAGVRSEIASVMADLEAGTRR